MIASLLISATIALSPVNTAPPVTVSSHEAVQTGVQQSAYQGEFYLARYESKRECIVQRESNGHYFSTNHKSGYYGAYQMNAPLARGVTWMMQPELQKMYGAEQGKTIARELRATPANRWHRFYQDMAFWTVANWRGPGTGLHHWNGGRWTC
jgi:hypothetical protein